MQISQDNSHIYRYTNLKTHFTHFQHQTNFSYTDRYTISYKVMQRFENHNIRVMGAVVNLLSILPISGTYKYMRSRSVVDTILYTSGITSHY